ncbi:diaminopimelate epimerase [Mesonia sp. K7]|uniref:diaminopimelate epimerase n=1 Tax=Mesonia sp. K7 TaxID=2218606 RepID=UPI000DAAB7A3|nr:diaminopimelate epimerase [Mesonia sp. K7]PZD77906.1 diaminopimelate epimerase [Mesonia sp. K7]
MNLKFYKYQGTGNDFVMIDNRDLTFKNDTKIINFLCDRRFGIGADGLILLNPPEREEDDFTMVYFNADGKESSMCGNGGRCIVSFAKFLGIFGKETIFTAVDGVHEAKIDGESVSLKMQDVTEVRDNAIGTFVNTGSPHHIAFKSDVESLDVKTLGAKIRHDKIYQPGGTNVNFVEMVGDKIVMRTFERGVEDETFSCGTGVTAAALAAYEKGKINRKTIEVITQGGNLSVSFEKNDSGYQNIWLTGPAKQVYQGEISC